METLRCPTCLTLILDSGDKRCSACHSKLRKRGAPIVLGESTRITNRPLLPFERDIRARVDAPNANQELWRRPLTTAPTDDARSREKLGEESAPALESPRAKDRRPRRSDKVARRNHPANAVAEVVEVAATDAAPEVVASAPEAEVISPVIDLTTPEPESRANESRWPRLAEDAAEQVDTPNATSATSATNVRWRFRASKHVEENAARADVDIPTSSVEPEPIIEVAADPEAIVEVETAEPIIEAAAAPEPEPEPEPIIEAAAAPEPEPEPEPEPIIEVAAAPEPEPEPEPIIEAAAEPEPAPNVEVIAAPEPEPAPEPIIEVAAVPAPAPEPVVEVAAEPEPEPPTVIELVPPRASEPDPPREPEPLQGRWRRFVDDAATRGAAPAPGATPTDIGRPRPSIARPDSPPPSPPRQSESLWDRITDSAPPFDFDVECSPESAPAPKSWPRNLPGTAIGDQILRSGRTSAPATGWYQLIAEATGRIEAARPIEVVADAEIAPAPIATKERQRRRNKNRHRAHTKPPTTILAIDVETEPQLAAPLVDEAPALAVELQSIATIEPEPITIAAGEIESRWNQLLAEASAHLDAETETASTDLEVESDSASKRRRLRRTKTIRPTIATDVTDVTDVTEDEPAIETGSELESPAIEDAITVEVAVEVAVEIEPQVEASVETLVEVEAITNDEPETTPVADLSDDTTSRWNQILAEAGAPIDVEPEIERAEVESRSKRRGLRRAKTIEPTVAADAIEDEAIVEAAETEAPIIEDALEPDIIDEVEVEITDAATVEIADEVRVEADAEIATVADDAPETTPAADVHDATASRWNQIFTEAGSHADADPETEAAEVVEGEVDRPSKRRRLRRAKTTHPTEAPVVIADEPIAEIAADTETATTEDTIEPAFADEVEVALVVEFADEVEVDAEIAAVTDDEPETTPVVEGLDDTASRWNQVIADAGAQIDTDPETEPAEIAIVSRSQRRRLRRVTIRPEADAVIADESITEVASDTDAPVIEDPIEPTTADDIAVEISDEAPGDDRVIVEAESAPVGETAKSRRLRRARAARALHAAPIANVDVDVDIVPVADIEVAEPIVEDTVEPVAAVELTVVEPASKSDPTETEEAIESGCEQLFVDTIDQVATDAEVELTVVEAGAEPILPAATPKMKLRLRRAKAARPSLLEIQDESAEAVTETDDVPMLEPDPEASVEAVAEPITETEPQAEIAVEVAVEVAVEAPVEVQSIVEVRVDAVEPVVEPAPQPPKVKERWLPAKGLRTWAATPPAAPRPIRVEAELITSTEPISTTMEPAVDITVEPIRDLVIALPTADIATEDTATEDTATEDTATEDTATEDTATEDTATEDTATEDTATEARVTEDPSPEPAAIVEPAPETAATVDSAPVEKRAKRSKRLRGTAPVVEDPAAPVAVTETDHEVDSVVEVELAAAEASPYEAIVELQEAELPASTDEPDEYLQFVDTVDADSEPVIGADDSESERAHGPVPSAAEGRWDRLVAESLARAEEPVETPAPAPRGRLHLRHWASPASDAPAASVAPEPAPITEEPTVDGATEPIIASAEPITQEPTVDGATEPLIASAEPITEAPQGRWERLVAESVARSLAAPVETAPAPKKPTRRQLRREAAARQIELPRWEAPGELEVDALVEIAPEAEPRIEVVTGAETTVVAEPAMTGTATEVEAAEPTVELATDQVAETEPTVGRWDRLMADAIARADSLAVATPAPVEVETIAEPTVVVEAVAAEEAQTIADVAVTPVAPAPSRRRHRRTKPARRIETPAADTEVADAPEATEIEVEVAATVAAEPELEVVAAVVVTPEIEVGTAVEPELAVAVTIAIEPEVEIEPEVGIEATVVVEPEPEIDVEAEPAVAAITIEEAPADVDLTDQPIVSEPTWNETEDLWRRLVAEAASNRTAASSATDIEIDIIVPAPTPNETNGRWRRLVAEVSNPPSREHDHAEVEVIVESVPAHAPAVIDLNIEPITRPITEARPSVTSMEIERLPRVGSDLRVMINALRRKTHTEISASVLPIEPGSRALPASESDDDEISDRRREA